MVWLMVWLMLHDIDVIPVAALTPSPSVRSPDPTTAPHAPECLTRKELGRDSMMFEFNLYALTKIRSRCELNEQPSLKYKIIHVSGALRGTLWYHLKSLPFEVP